jgi:hypothetical protein
MRQTEYGALRKMYGVSAHTRDLAGGEVSEKHDGRKVMISGRENDNRKILLHYNVWRSVLTEPDTERKPDNPSERSY